MSKNFDEDRMFLRGYRPVRGRRRRNGNTPLQSAVSNAEESLHRNPELYHRPLLRQSAAREDVLSNRSLHKRRMEHPLASIERFRMPSAIEEGGGSESKNLIATVGPCISQKSYEIKKDFKTKFLKQSKKNEIFFKKIKNKTYFCLNKYIYYQLKSLGLKKIDIIDKDTYNHKNNFFSARRSIHKKENDYGRNISIIMIN